MKIADKRWIERKCIVIFAKNRKGATDKDYQIEYKVLLAACMSNIDQLQEKIVLKWK